MCILSLLRRYPPGSYVALPAGDAVTREQQDPYKRSTYRAKAEAAKPPKNDHKVKYFGRRNRRLIPFVPAPSFSLCAALVQTIDAVPAYVWSSFFRSPTSELLHP